MLLTLAMALAGDRPGGRLHRPTEGSGPHAHTRADGLVGPRAGVARLDRPGPAPVSPPAAPEYAAADGNGRALRRHARAQDAQGEAAGRVRRAGQDQPARDRDPLDRAVPSRDAWPEGDPWAQACRDTGGHLAQSVEGRPGGEIVAHEPEMAVGAAASGQLSRYSNQVRFSTKRNRVARANATRRRWACSSSVKAGPQPLAAAETGRRTRSARAAGPAVRGRRGDRAGAPGASSRRADRRATRGCTGAPPARR